MNPIDFAMRRPFTVKVAAVVAIVLGSGRDGRRDTRGLRCDASTCVEIGFVSRRRDWVRFRAGAAPLGSFFGA